MILALALLTVTHLAPESTSARLLAPETIGVSGGPTARREVIPGVAPAWVPMVVAGGVTVTSVTATLLVMIAAPIGGWTALAVVVFGNLILAGVHGVCAVVSAIIGGSNSAARAEYLERKRAAAEPAPGGHAPELQPTAVVFRF